MPDSICAEISELRRGSSIGDSPGYFAPLIPDLAIRGFPELLVMAQFEPLSRASVERVSVGITELDLNMLVVGFDRSGTDPQFFRDTVCSEAGTNQPKDMQLAVGQITGMAICGRILDQVVNRDQGNPRADVKLTGQNNLDGMDQLFARTGLHPIAGGAGAEDALCVNVFRLFGYHENARFRKLRSNLLDQE